MKTKLNFITKLRVLSSVILFASIFTAQAIDGNSLNSPSFSFVSTSFFKNVNNSAKTETTPSEKKLKKTSSVTKEKKPRSILSSNSSKAKRTIPQKASLLTTDTDGDGVLDINDLDDDNDGILDATEAPSCYYTSSEANVITSISTGLTISTGTTPLLYNVVLTSATPNFAFTAAQALANANIFTVTYPTPVNLTSMTIVNTTSLGTSATALLQGSVNGTTWVDLTSAAVSISTSANKVFTVNQNAGEYQHYRIFGVATATSLANPIFEITSILNASYNQSSHPKPTCTVDTDNDGLSNNLDLDSDGDGCSDASEAGTTLIATSGVATANQLTASTIPAPYGINGFADGLETVADNGTYKGIYMYSNATSTTVNACTDTDGDGVRDIIDFDDDNDGILDVTEAPSCYYTASEANGIASISTGLTISMGTTPLLYNGVLTTATPNFAFTAAQALANANIFTVTYPTPVNLTSITVVNATSLGTGATAKLQGSVDGATWVDLTSAAVSMSTTANKVFTVNQNAREYQHYRIFGVATATSLANPIFEITSILNASYHPSAHPKPTCTVDNDNDGFINNLDLDSDGDGCSDASEAGTTLIATSGVATANQLTATTIPGPYGTNGFADGLETVAESGLYKSNYTYFYASDATTKACADTDTDGVLDINDLDDDNDGVLDEDERGACTAAVPTLKNIDGSTTGVGGQNAAFPSWMDFSYIEAEAGYNIVFDKPVSDVILEFASVYFQDKVGDFTATLTDGTVISGLDFDLSTTNPSTASIWTPQPTTGENFNGTFSKQIGSPFNTGTPYFKPITTTGQGWGIVDMKNIPGANTVGIKELSFKIIDGSATAGTAGLAIYSTCFKPSLDTDNDGTPNHLDLDSDGDGCTDAVEAGTTFVSTSGVAIANQFTAATIPAPYGTNGFADGLETSVDNGTYKGTYTYSKAKNAVVKACPDTDMDGIDDYDDLDDDNDGILDAAEAPSCYYTASEANVITSISTGLTISTGTTPLLYNGVLTTETPNFAFTADQALGNANIFTVTYPTPVNLTSMTIVNTFSLATSGTAKLQGSVDGTTWVDLTSAAVGINTTVNKVFTVNQNAGDYQYYRILGVATATSLDRPIFEITSILNASYNPSAHPKLTCTVDTDNDGINNNLDLDSDGDGCPDATEGGAGFTNANLVTSTISGGNSGTGYTGTSTSPVTQNLGNTVNAGGVPTIVGNGQTIGSSQNATINGCLDSDNDGIFNTYDLDDDNDGILDAVEAPSCYYTASEANVIASISTGLTISTGTTPLLYNGVLTTATPNFAFTAAQALANANIFTVTYPTPVNLTSMTVVNATSLGTSATAILQGSVDGATWVDLTSAAVSMSTAANKVFTVNQNAGEYQYYRIFGVATATSLANPIFEITSILNASYNPSAHPKPTCTVDTDNDGISNNLDLDSDGDGCSDAIEGGASFNTANLVTSTITGGNNGTGYTGTSSSPVTQNLGNTVGSTATTLGVPTLAGTGQAVGSSQIGAIQVCVVDTDNDGIIDEDDLDDDNDGILDVNERCGTTNSKLTMSALNDGVLSNGVATPTIWDSENVSGGVLPNTSIYDSANSESNGTSGIALASGSDGTFSLTMSAGNVSLVSTPNKVVTDAYVRMYELDNKAGVSITYTNLYDNAGTQLLTLSDIEFFGIAYGYVTPVFQSSVISITNPTPGTFVVTKPGSENTVYYNFRSKTGNLLATYDATTNNVASADVIVHNLFRVIQCNLDTDNDGIANHLDLDSDGDGCPDATEGGAGFTTANLVTSSISGGNSGTGYTGTSTSPVTQNLGNSVNAGGIPTIVGNGQTIGSSQNATINGCLDSDNDGIWNTYDLDDDNDGILDAVEASSCYYTASEANVIASISTGLTISTGTTPLLYNGVLTTATPNFAFTSAQAFANANIFTVAYPTLVNLTSMTIVNTTGLGSGANARLQGSVDGSNWLDLTSAAVGINTTVNKVFTVNQNAGEYQFYRIFGVATATSVANPIFEITSILNASYHPSAHPKPTCAVDTDNDSITNNLDLDSDGDGCFDAKESGVPSTKFNVTTGKVTGTVGTNGLADNLETATDNGIINYTATYSNAINALLNNCFCTQNPNTAPATSFTKVGISTQQIKRAGWPDDVPNGFIVLESKNKGFVVTRLTTAQRNALTAIEGMLLYNTSTNVMELYNGTTWVPLTKSCNQ